MDFETDTVQVGKFKVDVIRNDMYIGPCLRAGHEWDGWMRHDLPHVTRPGQDILDIGGNIGYNALMYSDYCTVHTFDPLFHPIISKNVNQNTLTHPVHVHPYGLSDAARNIDVWIHIGEDGKRNFGGTCIGGSPIHEKYKEARVERLDDVYTGTPCLVKIDVEGHELEVLKGAEMTIRKHKPNMYIEIFELDGPVPKLLREWGYTTMIPRPEHNYLFIR